MDLTGERGKDAGWATFVLAQVIVGGQLTPPGEGGARNYVHQ